MKKTYEKPEMKKMLVRPEEKIAMCQQLIEGRAQPAIACELLRQQCIDDADYNICS